MKFSVITHPTLLQYERIRSPKDVCVLEVQIGEVRTLPFLYIRAGLQEGFNLHIDETICQDPLDGLYPVAVVLHEHKRRCSMVLHLLADRPEQPAGYPAMRQVNGRMPTW